MKKTRNLPSLGEPGNPNILVKDLNFKIGVPKAGEVDQLVDSLPTMHEALDSSTTPCRSL